MARSGTTFKKGGKAGPGRPKGKLNKVTEDIREIAQQFGQEAIGTLVELMREADFETVKVAAAKELLDRAYGKSMQPVETNITQTIQYEISLAFGQPTATTHLQSDDALPARVSGPARNGSALVYNGRTS